MNDNKIIVFLLCVAAMLIVAACSNSGNSQFEENNYQLAEQSEDNDNDNDQEAVEDDPDPVTLKFATRSYGNEEDFQYMFADHIKEKYPHITLEMIPLSIERGDVEEAIARGDTPDIIQEAEARLFPLFDSYGLGHPLDDLIDKHNFDLNIIESHFIDAARAFDPGQENRLFGFPYNDGPSVLSYNKDVFDAFAVPYPEDGITWDETIELVSQLTGEVNGVEYKGIEMGSIHRLQWQQWVNETDPDTGSPRLLEEPFFQEQLGILERIASVPGLYEAPVDSHSVDGFSLLDRNVAMRPGTSMLAGERFKADDANFDIVTFPHLSDHPGITTRPVTHTLSLSPTSDHLDDAFKVISYFVSDEYQQWMASEVLRLPVSSNEEVKLSYGSSIPGFAERYNVEALFKDTPAAPPERLSQYDPLIEGFSLDRFREFIVESVNDSTEPVTFLREIEEMMEIELQEVLESR